MGKEERGTTAADFDANLPPQTLKSNLGITAQLLRSKIGATENNYKQTMGRDDFQQRFITPEAQASLQRWSPGSGGGPSPSNQPKTGFTRITASDGSVHDIPSDKLNLAKQRDPGLKVQQ